ncbi:MAG: MCE family protein [Armatimonadetes bacterium]|nr:MCE family protein [Armatimonadota bacterium]
MTNNVRYNFLVGIASLLSLALLFWGFAYLSGRIAGSGVITVTAVFKDAGGVLQGGEVQMAGVRVGTVGNITLNAEKQAEVVVKLDKKYPVPNDSLFVVEASVLGSVSRMAINPGSPAATPLKDGDRVIGQTPAGLQDLVASGSDLAPKLIETLDSVQVLMAKSEKLLDGSAKLLTSLDNNLNDAATQKKLRTTLANIEAITANLDATTSQLPRLTQTAEGQLTALSGQSQKLLRDLDDAAISGKRIAVNGERITASLDVTLNENRQNLKNLLQSADESASALAGLLKQSSELIGDPELKKNIVATTANLAATTARLETVTANIENLSGDPRLAADLRDTVANLKETSASVKNIVNRVETIRLPGERRPQDTPPIPPKPAAATSLIEPGLAIDGFYDTTNPRFRADANYTLRLRDGAFVRGGLSDFGEGNGLNLQAGQSLGRNGESDFAYRYGLFGGKLGLGLDASAGLFDFRLEGFDPNRFSGNARAKLYLNRERTQSLLFGFDDIARDNRATIGVQFRQ